VPKSRQINRRLLYNVKCAVSLLERKKKRKRLEKLRKKRLNALIECLLNKVKSWLL